MTQAIAKCILSCGLQPFFEDFFTYICDELAVDQCNIFLVKSDGGISCLVARNFLEGNITNQLAESYMKNGYKEDPNITLIKKMSAGKSFTIHWDEYIHKVSQAYREEFFSNPGLVDKVAIMVKEHSYSLYINLYRCSGKRTFRDDKLFLEHNKENIVSALITKHYRLNSSLISEGPLEQLSERERQVCKGILNGKKTEAIAFDLNLSPHSVITYRRRAYQKLGITSRSALFALSA